MSKIYVTMTDKFMSGWGKSENKINKLVFECDTWDDAHNVIDNANQRPEMKHIRTALKRPNYGPGYLISYMTKQGQAWWYKRHSRLEKN